jgi:hypothetical protein
MRYVEDPIGQEPIVDGYIPTRIIVKMMSGKDHTLFTENDNETFLDVKMALLPHLSSTPVLDQLVFQSGNQEIGYNSVDDSASVLSLTPHASHIIELQLLLREREWSPEQQHIIDMTSEEYLKIRVNTLDKLEAFRWGIQHNSSIKSIHTNRSHKIILPIIMDILRDSTTIENLLLVFDDDLNVDEMAQLFEAIGQNNTLKYISIYADFDCTYRLNDLAELLRINTSLDSIDLTKCNVIIGDATRFVDDLDATRYVLNTLNLTDNIISDEDLQELSVEALRSSQSVNYVSIDQFRRVNWLTNTDILNTEISLLWKNPNSE